MIGNTAAVVNGRVDNQWKPFERSWHAVANSSELGPEPLPVWLLGRPWCLVRLAGQVVALADRCPHRLAPLSAGRVEGDTLRCGYHGWRYDASGQCVEIPSGGGEAIPSRACVERPHAVTERYGLVWMAPETPLAPLPEFPEWDSPRFDRTFSTVVRTQVGAALLVDNFLDAAHFPYVHAATFGAPESAPVSHRGVERDGWQVETTFDTWYRNEDDPLVATGEHEAVQPQILTKRGGASTTVVLRLQFPVTGATIGILFSCSPETTGVTRVFKLLARDDLAGDEEALAHFVHVEDRILQEDLAILERYRDNVVHLDPRVEVHTRADRLSLAWRRVLADMAETAAIET